MKSLSLMFAFIAGVLVGAITFHFISPILSEKDLLKPTQGTHKPVGSIEGSKGLIIDSEPSGATVYIDSEYRGVTPMKVTDVPAGSIHISLVKDGFMRHDEVVSLNVGEEKSLKIVLENALGEIFIKTTPSGAQVYVDEELIQASTPVIIRRVIREKVHSIKIVLTGYHPWSTTVDLSKEAKKEYNILLVNERQTKIKKEERLVPRDTGNPSQSVSNGSPLTLSLIKNAADREAVGLGYKIEDMTASFDDANTQWKKYSALTQRENESTLKGKDFVAVHYALKESTLAPKTLGGDLWVFVDRPTGVIITILRGK